MFKKTLLIPKGYEATLTADVFLTIGLYGRIAQPGSGTQYAPVVIEAEDEVTLGPFNEDRQYFLQGDNGDISYVLVYSGNYTAVDAAGLVTDLAGKADAVGAANIVDVTDTATGAELATAINSIIAALIAAGIVLDAE